MGFFSSRFCLVGVPADFCLFFLSFFFFRFSVVVAFSSVFFRCASEPGTDPPLLLQGEEEEPLRWLPGRLPRLGK